jgi:quinol monooxygenase YgiN
MTFVEKMKGKITMSQLTIVAKLVAKKESVGSVRSELLKMIAPTRSESGCIEYNLHQDNDDPAVFILYENWESVAGFETHKSTEHYKAYVRALDGLLEEKVVNKMTLVE